MASAPSLGLPADVSQDTGPALGAMPRPRPMFLLGWRGNLLRMAQDPLGYLVRVHAAHGDVVALVTAGNCNSFSTVPKCPGTVAAFGPRCNREILGNPSVFHISLRTGLEGTPLAHLGAGVFNANGADHQDLRRDMAPAFHPRMNQAYHLNLVTLTRQMLDGWRPEECRDVALEMERLTFRSVCKNFYDFEPSPDIDDLGELIRRWVRMAYAPATRLLPDWPLSPYRHFTRVSQRLSLALARLVAAGSAGNEKARIGQTLSLLIASHDTTSAALTWTLFLLSQHPQVWADAVDEVSTLQGEPPTLEQLSTLPLLERVLKESMRLLPPVPFAGRVAAEPTALGPYQLPRGTEVIYSQHITHRQPDIYPRPAAFLPERWLCLDPSPYEYLPFGAGPRRCLGAQLALVQMKTILAMVLQRYHLQLRPNARVDHLVRLVLTPRDGLPMVVGRPRPRLQTAFRAVRGSIRGMVDLPERSS